MLRREEVERIKEQYPKGTPVRLYSMEGEQTVPPGSRGVVDHVDDIGQIHMKWENGSSLALNVEEDRFDIITHQDEISEKKEQEFIDKINEILDKTDFLLLYCHHLNFVWRDRLYHMSIAAIEPNQPMLQRSSLPCIRHSRKCMEKGMWMKAMV